MKAPHLQCKKTSAKKKSNRKKKIAITEQAIIPILGAVQITANNAINPVLLKNIPPPATRATTILVRLQNPALHENILPPATILVHRRKIQVHQHSITLQKART